MTKNYSFSRKFVEGEAISGFWNLAFHGITTLNSFIIVYFLSVYEFGLYQLILSVIIIAKSLTAGFLDDLVFVDLSHYLGQGKAAWAKRLLKEYAFVKIGLAILFILLILGSAEIISSYFDRDVSIFLRIISIALLFQVTRSVFELFFQGKIYFSALGASVVGEIVKSLVILGLFWWQGLGIVQILIAHVIGHFSSFLFSGVHFFKLYSATFKATKSVKEFLIRDIVKVHGFWIFLRYIFAKIGNNIKPWIIKLFLNTEAVGLFTFAREFVSSIMTFMPLGTIGVLLPRELEDRRKLQSIFSRVVKYSAALSGGLAFLSFVSMPLAINLIFPKYNPAVGVFQMMTIVIFLFGFYKIFRMALVSFKDYKTLFIKSLDNSILAPLMLFVLLPIFGMRGAALEWVFTYSITTALFYYSLIKNRPYLRLTFKNFFKVDKYDKEIILRIWRAGVDFLRVKLFKGHREQLKNRN